MIKVFFFRFNTKNSLFLLPILLEIRGKLTYVYVCIFAARSHDQKYIYEGQSKISESYFISDKRLLVLVVFV